MHCAVQEQRKQKIDAKDRNENRQSPPPLPACDSYIGGAIEHWSLRQVSIPLPHSVASRPLPFPSLCCKKIKSQQHSHPHTQTHTHTHTIPELPTTTTNSYNQTFIGARGARASRAAPQKPTKTSRHPNRLKLPKSQSTNNPKRKRKRASPRKKEQPSCDFVLFFLPSSSIIMTFTAILEKSSRSLQSLKNHDFYCKQP